jgi:hydroxyacylglutathione hydrolase
MERGAIVRIRSVIVGSTEFGHPGGRRSGSARAFGIRMWVVGAVALIGLGCGSGSGETILSEDPGLRIVRLTVAAANVYIVEQGDVSLMIDAGNPGDEGDYEDLMREQGIDPASLDYLLITHGHADHAGTAAYFQQTYGVQVIGGRGDQPMIDAMGKADLCPTSFLAEVLRRVRSGITYPSFTLDLALEMDAEAFDLSELGMSGTIWPSPGHTPGSVVAVIADQAFVGDLIRGGVLDSGRPETHFFMCDLAENRQRIREVLEHAEIAQWNPGHLGPFPPPRCSTISSARTSSARTRSRAADRRAYPRPSAPRSG